MGSEPRVIVASGVLGPIGQIGAESAASAAGFGAFARWTGLSLAHYRMEGAESCF